MVNLIIASANKEKMKNWLDVLEPLYSVEFSDSIEKIIATGNHNENTLLVLDALLIDEEQQLVQVCHTVKKVIVVGENLTADQQIKLIYQGAWGYSDYLLENRLIVRAIESVLSNEVWLERQLIPHMLKEIVTQHNLLNNEQQFNTINEIFSVLTHREIEVIEMVYKGVDNLSISKALNITSRTVKAHMGAIYRKLEVHDRFQLLVFLKDLQMGSVSNENHFL